MRLLSLTIIVYVAAVIETSLADVFRVGPITPDLLALTAVAYLLIATGPRSFLTAGAIALAADLIASGHLGVGAAWMLMVGYAIGRLRTRLPLDNLAVQVLVVLVAGSVWATAVGLTGRILGDVSLPWSTIVVRAIAVGLYTAGVGLPVLMVVGWVREPFLARRRRLAEM